MPNRAGKTELGENHRRAVSVLIRGTERACDGVLEWIERPSSMMTEVRDDLSAKEKVQLRELASGLKSEIRSFLEVFPLDKSAASRRRSIAAIISAACIDLEEVVDSGLKGYGPQPPDAREALNQGLTEMIKILEQMLPIAERG
jgi:hypothetical protein